MIRSIGLDINSDGLVTLRDLEEMVRVAYGEGCPHDAVVHRKLTGIGVACSLSVWVSWDDGRSAANGFEAPV